MKCPECKNEIPLEVFYCPICGKKIKEKPVVMDFWHLALLFGLCALLPPFNLSLSMKYIKSPDKKARNIGWISLGVMAISLILVTWWGVRWAQEVNRQVNEEMGRLLNY